MEQGTLPVVRLADDGELDDVRNLLDQLGVDWVASDEEPERPTALWIANPRRFIAAREAAATPGVFRIVVSDKMTRTLQRELERNGPDFLVTRPFHAAALRLVILHALYAGPERRASARVATSAAIRFRAGVFSRAAMLVELSRGGCRLVAAHLPGPQEPITVILPRELTGNGGLSIAGRVVAVDPAGGWEPGEQACSVAFEALDIPTRRTLRKIMESQSVACATLEPRAGLAAAGGAMAPLPQPSAAAPAKTAEAPRKPASGPSERRRSPRRPFPRPVLASSAGSARTLLGRDLSSGGMRVAPDDQLAIGDELKLVIYGPAGRPPLLMRAKVSRIDGDRGCVLRFQDVPAEAAAELEQWTDLLPKVPESGKADAPATHSVVSEVVEDSEASD
jgi:hypothetical protein